jgi:hypothetical protein
MKAFVISEYAHPSEIQLTCDAPEPIPTPGADELLIDVHSAGLNFFDVRFLFPMNLLHAYFGLSLTYRSMLYNVDTAISGKISNAAPAAVRARRRVRRNRRICATREPVQARRPHVRECTGRVRRARRREARRCPASARYAFVRPGSRYVARMRKHE